jgi:hypothetical protein
VTAVVLLDDIVERSPRRYLVTEVLNMWEVSMAGSHTGYRSGGLCSFPGAIDFMRSGGSGTGSTLPREYN